MKPAEGVLGRLDEACRDAGLRYAVAGAGMISEMARSLDQLRDRGIMPAELFSEYAKSLGLTRDDDVSQVVSIIVVAAPSPAVKVAFDLGGRTVEAVVPPTYVSGRIRRETADLLRGVLGPSGHSVERVPLPVKMLAVRTGLAHYGRNGIAYVEGMGSFVRLDAYGTDAVLVDPEAGADPSARERLPVPPRIRACMSCSYCYHSCPTGCIDRSGDRLDPLRCLTYLNEHDGDWPSWLDPRAHNSLVGCMACQRGCRYNQDNGYIAPESLVASFDREETGIILEGRDEAELPEQLRLRLEALDLAGYSTVLGRNLRALTDS